MSNGQSFAVNGRFLTQNVTGVQRYARNVLLAMNESLSAQSDSAPIIAPAGAPDLLLSAMPLASGGPFVGHLWEQFILPARWHGSLLNLCNTAPAFKADQVVCIHDANVFVAPDSYSAGFRTAYAALHRSLAQRVLRVATVSDFSARQIAKYLPVRASDIAVLSNGHEHALGWDSMLARIAPEICKTSSALAEGRFVLALGSRARHKNMKLLLDAAPNLASLGIEIVIAGGGSDIFAAESLPSTQNVTVIGYVSDDDLAYLMDRALCLVFPSWTEGFGLPIVEAMARGCPVVASDRASIPEVCGNAALLAPPDKVSAWVCHVRALTESPELRQTLIGRGFEQVKKFTWANTAAGYIDLMRDPSRFKTRVLQETQPLPKVAVVVATLGRPEIVTATLKHLLETQTLRPTAIIVSCVTLEDAGQAANLPGVSVVLGSPGSSIQRNVAFDILGPEIDVVVFFDDDFVADPQWLAAAARAFRDEPDIFGFTGDVLADGIKGPGLSFEEARKIVDTPDRSGSWSRIEPYSPYGCNMAFRRAAVGNLRFDERLVLYGWLEDRDFGGALTRSGGRLVKCASARGVHMGTKRGRVAGDRLGYSQVVNPLYLVSKKTMTPGQAINQISRNIISNLVRSPTPEPFIDRRGRLRGNFRGLSDVLRGRLEPERAAMIMPASPRQAP